MYNLTEQLSVYQPYLYGDLLFYFLLVRAHALPLPQQLNLNYTVIFIKIIIQLITIN